MDLILTMVEKKTVMCVDYRKRNSRSNIGTDLLQGYFFDLINDWDQDILQIYESDKDNLLWVVMGDGSVFRLCCEKEPFPMFKPPE